jgi:DNA-binding MarR family transcriptional regulator
MENQALFELNFDVWLTIADLQHKMVLIRDKELIRHGITPRQMQIMRLIDALGPEATISVIARAMERKLDVVSRQTFLMERDGLIKRVQEHPKSRLLKLELTEKGQDFLKISRFSEGMNEISPVLTEQELLQLDSLLKRLLAKTKEYNIKYNNGRQF